MFKEHEVETDWSRARKTRIEGRFLKGPIPFTHLAAAARLPGHALTVLLAVYHQTALTRKDWVSLPKGLLSELGVSRDSKARALHALQEASLVSVERCKGRTARVMLRPSASQVVCGNMAFAGSTIAVRGDNPPA
jgi:hypothetical protein